MNAADSVPGISVGPDQEEQFDLGLAPGMIELKRLYSAVAILVV